MTAPDHGLVVGGQLVPNTDWILRDPTAWWEPGERGTRRRDELVELLVGHWTAGEAGTSSVLDDGPRVVRVMKGRRRADGSPMNVGIHFVIGAPASPEGGALVWQTADPGKVATVHVGRGSVNARSIGVEVVSAGLPGQANVRERPEFVVDLLGRPRRVLALYPGQLRAWVRLAEVLAELRGLGGIQIPRRVPALAGEVLVDRRLTPFEMRRWRGASEHYLTPGTKKVDAAGLLLGALGDVGWDRVDVAA